ncbi:hypothetical protein Ccrd_000082, partial [Cynara cardunculus var. scolymus]
SYALTPLTPKIPKYFSNSFPSFSFSSNKSNKKTSTPIPGLLGVPTFFKPLFTTFPLYAIAFSPLAASPPAVGHPVSDTTTGIRSYPSLSIAKDRRSPLMAMNCREGIEGVGSNRVVVPVAIEGRSSLGTPIVSWIPEPENDWSDSGLGLNSRMLKIPLVVMTLTAAEGGGRLLATRP